MIIRMAAALHLIPWRALSLMCAGALLTVFYFGSYVGRLEPPDPVLARAADRVVEQAVNAMPAERTVERVLVLPLAGDHTRYLRDAFSKRVAASGKYAVINLGVVGDRLRDIGLDVPVPATRAEALRVARLLPGERVL